MKKLDALESLRTLSQANKVLLALDSEHASKVQEGLAVVLNDTIDAYLPRQGEFNLLQRQVFNRYYFGGQSLREIALATGRNYDYIRSVHANVKAKLGNFGMDDLKAAFEDADTRADDTRADFGD